MPATASLSGPAGLREVARVDNFNLQNATPTILTYTLPNDGRNHNIIVSTSKIITVAETGGHCQIIFTDGPSGKSQTLALFGGGAAPGLQVSGSLACLGPGSTVVVQQDTALTVGASNVNIRVVIS